MRLITGASRGLGRALAESALGRGDQVVVTCRDVRAARDLEQRHPGRRPNDPGRVADAIVAVADDPEPPLRLALGTDAVDTIRDKLAVQARELDRWDELSRSTSRGDG